MDIDDNDAQDQNLHIVGEQSSKVSPVLHSYPLPKFEFDDSLQGHLRYDNLVDNGALEDNHWIEEYSTRKNVWSEATSSESVEMLLKSVGQEEKVLEESNRHSSLTSVMDPKGASESVVLGDETVDNNTSTNSDAIVETRTYNVEKLEVVLNVESVDKPLVEAEATAEVILSKDETTGNMEKNVVRAADSPKNVEGVITTAQPESNMDVLTDAVVAVESSKTSSPNTPDGVHLPSGAVATSDNIIEDLPRSPILGVSLLPDDNKEKLEPELTSERTSQNQTSEVEKVTVSDADIKAAHLNANQSEQTEAKESQSILDPPKESMTGKDKHDVTLSSSVAYQNLNLSKNMVSSVSSHGSQLDPIKLPEDSSVKLPEAKAKGKPERKPRKKPVGTETTNKPKTPSKRSRKVEKSLPLTPHATGHFTTTVSNPKPSDTTPISTSKLPVLNKSFTDNQQLQLRAQILVYGSVLSGIPPEEPHMIAAFGQSDGARRSWESTWHAYLERTRGPKSQPNNPSSTTPTQSVKTTSPQTKTIPTISSPNLNPIIPITSQSNPIPKSNPSHNPMWLSQGPFPGQWLASSPAANFNARLSSFPITESVKLTTVKESSGPTVSSMVLSPGQSQSQTSSDPKSRKRKKVVSSHSTTPFSIKSNSGIIVPPILSPSGQGQGQGQSQGQLTHVDQMSKIEESKAEAAEAAVDAANAVTHCQNVWSQLESQQASGLVSENEAKLSSSAVTIAAACSIAKVAAAAAKLASNVAEQAKLMADEVILLKRTESRDESGTASVITAAKEAARRRVEAALSASKHAENLDAIVKAAELAAEAVAQAGKIVAIGNPLSLKELIEAGPDGYWKSDKQNVETVVDEKVDSGDLVKNQMVIDSHEKDKSVAADVDPNMVQSNSGTWNDNVIKEGCLVEVRKDSDKKKSAWFAANVSTLKDGKAFVCYTELLAGDGSGKLKEWVPLEVEGTEPPMLRIAHPMTNMRSEGTRKRGRTTLTDYTWCIGDRVDVWVQDCWCEAVVVEINKMDLTSLVVQFPGQGETSAVRSWQVRPTLIWKDGKWIEWSSPNRPYSSEGDTPHEKRHKISNPIAEAKDKSKSSNNANLVESARHQESRNIPLSSQGDLQKKQSRVVFGVPKPGKKQKFITMSTHHDDDKNNKNNTSTDSIKLVVDLMPQASSKEKQVAEVKPKATKRKPPVPSVKTLTQKDKSKSKSKPSKPASPEALTSDENLSSQPMKTDSDSKESKVEVEDKSTSETEQPRRSVRRIQPTSRLLEGLQSSLTVSVSPRNHNKVTSKGGTNSS